MDRRPAAQTEHTTSRRPPARARRGALALALVLAAAGCRHRPALAQAEDRPVIVSFEIEGASQLNPDEIKAGLATRATGSFPWSTRQRFDPVVFDTDLKRIQTYYRLQGFYGARIVDSAVEPAGDNKVALRVRIDEGPPTRLRGLDVNGIGELSGELQRQIRRQIPLAVGARFRAQAYETARTQVQQVLRAAGYARAEVNGHVDVFPEQQAADVRFDIERGEIHRFGDIELRGVKTLPQDKVAAVARRAMPRGARITPVALEQAQTVIYELGVFDAVRVTLPEKPAADPADTPVVVTVQEAPAHSISLGGGVAVERSLQQLQVLGNYRNYNSLGSASRLSWNNTLSLQFLPSVFALERAGLGAQTTLEFTVPEVWSRTDAAVQVGYERVFRPAFEANALSARLGTPIHPLPRFQIVPALNFERYYGGVGRAINGSPPPGLSNTCPEPCRIGFPSIDVQLDRRDDPISPRRGSYLLVNFQWGTPVLGSHFSYLRLSPEVRGYLPAAQGLVLAGRVRVGAMQPFGGAESPLVQRFFGGGEAGHRGFGPDLQSPLVQDRTGAFVPVGGNGLWLVTGEARLRFSRSWGMVVFADYGEVTERPLRFDFAEAPLALGLGGRYYTLAGPIRLDVAGRLSPTPRLAFNTGARADTRLIDYFTVFISLGESF